MKKEELSYREIKGVFERMFYSSITGEKPLSAGDYNLFSALTEKQVMTMQDLAKLCKKYEDSYNKSSSKFHWSLNHARQYRDLRDEFVKRLQVFNKIEHNNTSSADIHSGQVIRLISSEETAISLQAAHIKSLRSCSTKKKSCKWIHFGETVEVNGQLLTKGFFYIGEYFKIPQSYRLISKFDIMNRKYRDYNRCYKLFKIYGPVLQKELPISQGNLQIVPFSSYLDMHPTHRFEYLEWLTGNKSVSQISTETFLFYLFGLQLRMFIDEDTTQQDRLDIVKYSTGLFVQCKNENVFYQELINFIDASISKFFPNRLCELVPKEMLPLLTLSRGALIYNAYKDSKGKTTEDILSDICRSIISILNFEETIPSHLLNENFYRQFVKIVCESGKFVSIIEFERTNKWPRYETYCMGINNNYSKFHYDYIFCFWLIPNFNNIKIVYNSFATYFKEVAKQIKNYKVLYPVSPTLALFVLPPFFSISGYDEVSSLVDFIRKKTIDQEYVPIDINEILCYGASTKELSSISKSQVSLIINCLDKIGYNIVPNIQLNEEQFSYGDICIIYKKANRDKIEIENGFSTLIPIIKAAAFIIGEKASPSIIKIADDFIKLNVHGEESARHLIAYLRWRLINPLLNPNDYKTIKKIETTMKEVLSELLVHLSCADGNFTSQKQEKLTRILSLIDISPLTMHTLIHRISTKEDEFATIEKVDDAVEYTIEGKTNPRTFSLNKEHLASIETQTKQAQELLSDIFVDNEERIDLNSNSNNVILDIMKVLLSKNKWQRNEVELICQKHHLMLGYVLEQINDYSYNKIEDTVIEDNGDTIYVMTEYKDKLI